MTTRATKTTRPAVTERKGKKLALSKKTLADLTPGGRQGRAIRGGVGKTNTCTYAAYAGC